MLEQISEFLKSSNKINGIYHPVIYYDDNLNELRLVVCLENTNCGYNNHTFSIRDKDLLNIESYIKEIVETFGKCLEKSNVK